MPNLTLNFQQQNIEPTLSWLPVFIYTKRIPYCFLVV